MAFFVNSFCFKIPNSDIIPVKSFSFVLSNGGFRTLIFSWRSSQTSLPERSCIVIFFVNFKETPQVYVGTSWSFASFVRVDVPILFATSVVVNASAPKRKRLHFDRECSAAKSGAMIVLILDFARSLAVFRPWSNGSTSVV